MNNLICPVCSNQVNPSPSDYRVNRKIIFCSRCKLGFTKIKFVAQNSTTVSIHRFNKIVDKLFVILKLSRFFQLIRFKHCVDSYLDWGCGRGETLQIAKVLSWQAVGVEANEITILDARNSGLNCLTVDQFNKSALSRKKFDLVSAFHVLEHVSEPKKFVAMLKSKVKKNGTLIIEVPNIESLQAKLARDNWSGLDYDHHFTHFNLRSLRKLCEDSNLIISNISTFSFEYGAIMFAQSMLNFLNPIPQFPYIYFEKKLNVRNFSKSEVIFSTLITTLCIFPLLSLGFLTEVLGNTLKKGSVIRLTLNHT